MRSVLIERSLPIYVITYEKTPAERTPLQLNARTLSRIHNYLIKANVTLRKAQETCKANLKKRVRSGISVTEVNKIYLDRPRGYAIS